MDIKKIDWQKVVGRRADLQKAIQFSCTNAGGFGKFFGLDDLAHQLYYFDGRTTSIYFSTKEYAKFLDEVNNKLADVEFVKKCENEILNVCEKCIHDAEVLSSNAEKANGDAAEQKRIFEGFKGVWNDFYPIGWSFFFIAGFENILRKNFIEAGFSEKEANEVIEVGAKPDKFTPVMEVEIETLKLAKAIKSGEKNIQELSQLLSDKFGWMSVYNTEDKTRPAEYYIKEVQNIIASGINIEDKINFIEESLQKNEKVFVSYLKKITAGLLREQLKFFHASGYLRDKREEARDRVTILQRPLYAVIAAGHNLSVNEVVHLSDEEIDELLTNKEAQGKLKKTAEERMERYVFIIEQGNLEIIDDEKKINEVAALFNSDIDAKEIKGQVGYKQSDKVRGIAKIVFSNKELEKVNKGDVLVTTMTKPDFIVAMEKAAAFVTDEGGITCHAAIVAREMRKPCIIGTKIATKVLKDGDMVEVDAEEGIVKIIKKA